MSTHRTGRNWAWPVMIVVAMAGIVILVVGAGLLAFGSSSDSSSGTKLTGINTERKLPDYVLASGPRVALAYQFALDRPDVMLWMPCYCGCGDHAGHRNARDCFVKPAGSADGVSFEEHGSACDVCVGIAVLAREMTLDGHTLREIRAAVDDEFGDVGPGTDTPLPSE